jgi:nickel-type superoxide dismutase maturation protease
MIFFRQVKGNSMKPTLRNGQLVFAHEVRKFRVGQVVIAFVHGKEVIKRITKIKNGSVYLQGDNPDESTDSREYGPIPDSKIEGVVFFPRVFKELDSK